MIRTAPCPVCHRPVFVQRRPGHAGVLQTVPHSHPTEGGVCRGSFVRVSPC